MKDELINNSIIFKHIKFLLRSLCHYNNSDNINYHNDDYNMCARGIIDDNNGYNEDDTLETIKIQLSIFLKDIIDDNKLEQFLRDYIDDNNCHLEDYLLSNEYDDIKQEFIEEYNTINIFKNYDFNNQPHLYNYKTSSFFNSQLYDIQKRRLVEAIKLYMNKNGLNNNTIQIRYNIDNQDMNYYIDY